MNLLEQAQAAGVQGFLHPVECDKLAELAAGKHCVEIGAFKGLSAWVMAQTAASVLSIDTFRADSAGTSQLESVQTLAAYLIATAGFPHCRYMISESAAAAKKLQGQKFDLVFIDADHSYEAVKRDIAAWWPRVKKGGIMVFHDYHRDHGYFPGVYQAVVEKFGELPQAITLAWTKPKPANPRLR